MDFNVQWDTRAAEVVAATARLTMVTLPATLNAHLRRADLPRLRAAGPLGQLLARQSEAHAETYQMEKLGRDHSGLPDDLLNFQYDPVTCAVALGWSGATVEDIRVQPLRMDDVLSFQPHSEGRSTRVVLNVDGAAFRETWLSAVEAAGSSSS
jgi:inosine-uridine nucleoside N-ribohydrolase